MECRMKVNKKLLLVACVCASVSMNVWAAESSSSSSSSSTTSSSTTVQNTGDSTRISRVQSSTSTSSSTWSHEERSSTTKTSAGIGIGSIRDYKEHVDGVGYVMADVDGILNPYRNTPRSLKIGKGKTFKNDEILEHGVLAAMKEKGKWGVLRPDGTVAVSPKYKAINDVDYSTGNVLAQIDKKTTTWVTPNGNEISAAEALKERVAYERESQYPSDSYIEFKEKGKYGFKTADDKVVIAPQYRQIITGFSEDRAFVKNAKGKIVAIDGTGKELFFAPTKEIYAYDNGLAEYRRAVSGFNLGGLVGGFVLGGIIGGALLSSGHYYHVGGFVYDGAKRGYIDRNGTIVVDSKNDKVWPMTSYGTVVQNKGLTTFVNRKGETIIPGGKYDVGEMDRYNGLLALKDENSEKWGVFNVTDGHQVVPFKYDSISFAGSDRLVVTQDYVKNLVEMTSGRSMYSAQTEATIDPFNTDTVTWVHTGKSNYSIIDNNGHTLFKDVNNIIEEARSFNHGYAAVKSKGKWGIMNSKGAWITQPIYEAINIL